MYCIDYSLLTYTQTSAEIKFLFFLLHKIQMQLSDNKQIKMNVGTDIEKERMQLVYC